MNSSKRSSREWTWCWTTSLLSFLYCHGDKLRSELVDPNRLMLTSSSQSQVTAPALKLTNKDHDSGEFLKPWTMSREVSTLSSFGDVLACHLILLSLSTSMKSDWWVTWVRQTSRRLIHASSNLIFHLMRPMKCVPRDSSQHLSCVVESTLITALAASLQTQTEVSNHTDEIKNLTNYIKLD